MNENDFRDVAAMFAMNAMMTAGYWDWHEPEKDTRRCYAQADALYEARSKEPEQESGIAAFKPKRNTAKKAPNAK